MATCHWPGRQSPGADSWWPRGQSLGTVSAQSSRCLCLCRPSEVSAVAAARCGASVQVVEPNPTARSALGNVFREEPSGALKTFLRGCRCAKPCPGANKVTELVTVIPDVAASSSFDVCAIEGKCRKECMFLCSQSKHWRSSGAVQDWSLMAF